MKTRMDGEETPRTRDCRPAGVADAVVLSALINRAFQAESPFIKGDRTNESQILEKLQTGSFLLMEEQGSLLGCVYLEVAYQARPNALARGEGAGYIGMLAIEPSQQGRGLGKQLMRHAEAELERRGCQKVQIRIVHRRTALLDFYGRLGYRTMGESPYPAPEKTIMPLHFINVEKSLL
jgi:ribosomal protein S18 acetylase RimI-like enzyme